jgi:anti-sigma-K factor RskA
MSTETHILELLPAYTLDCLDEEEFIQVSEHLAACAECRDQLHFYQTVTDQLALAVPGADPPIDLKQRLMDRVRPSRPAPSPQPQLSWWDHLTRLMPRATPVWGLASLVLIAALAISYVWLWQQLSRPQPLTEPGVMRTIPLSGTQVAPQASGLLVISIDGEHGTLVVDGLSPLKPGLQYQLWLIRDDQRTSGGVFSVSEEGYGSLWISSLQPLSSYSAVGVTIEPEGGSPGPTGDKVLGGTL